MTLSAFMRARLVRYDELRPCTNAFIDARSPGSDQKENFTIIGPGVAENPHQHVHIRETHGFNIGGARQPPRCTNSLHSHQTEEVFIIHSGQWRFFWGEHGDAGEVFLAPGDTISIPVNLFRGFENVGQDKGFMFAILGGDDPGRVLWAPHVIEKARNFGLVLLEDGSLVDTTLGEKVPNGKISVRPATPAEIAHIRDVDASQMAGLVVHHADLVPDSASMLSAKGVSESRIIGTDADAACNLVSPITLPHNFTLSHLAFSAGAVSPMHRRQCNEVLMVFRGALAWRSDDGNSVELGAGDTFTIPRGMAREMRALTDAEVFVVRGGR